MAPRSDQETDSDRAKKAAETQAALAAARASDQDAAKLAAEARKVTLEADALELGVARQTRQEKEELAKDHYHHTYVFDSQVGDSSVKACILELTNWMRQSPGCEIEIVFDSPGGSVLAGLALYDFIRSLQARGHRIITSSIGMAASMAGILLQSGDHRAIGRESYVLIHEISTGAIGKIGEIEDEVEFVKKIQKRILNIFASRSRKPASYFAKHWKRKDWWLDAEECLELGLVDEIR